MPPKQTPTLGTISQQNKITFSDGLIDFLREHGCSFVFTSYDAGAVYFIGQSENRLTFSWINLGRAMGLTWDGKSLFVAGRSSIYRFANVLPERETDNGHDVNFFPRDQYFTGDLDIHEISNDSGRLMFAATRYSCVGGLSDNRSMEVLWKPDFISKIVPEDRCHLNGLYVEKGKPRLVSIIGKSDSLQGWRCHREAGGMLLDCQTGGLENNLSMPHSPRYFNGKLAYNDSGTGFLYVTANKIDVFCPGFLRGLSFYKTFALVTVSLPRDGIFKGLPLQGELAKRGGEAMCAVLIIDIERGSIIHWLRIEGPTRELFDCVWLPGVVSPSAKAPGDPALNNRISF